MAKNETLNIRVNDVIKLRAEKTLDVLGLSISEAVNMLLHQIIRYMEGHADAELTEVETAL